MITSVDPNYPYEGLQFYQLSAVTESATANMLRKVLRKLSSNAIGTSEFSDLAVGGVELYERSDDPGIASTRAALVEELLHWRIVTDDDLPLGDYVTERAVHDWDWALGGSVVAGA